MMGSGPEPGKPTSAAATATLARPKRLAGPRTPRRGTTVAMLAGRRQARYCDTAMLVAGRRANATRVACASKSRPYRVPASAAGPPGTVHTSGARLAAATAANVSTRAVADAADGAVTLRLRRARLEGFGRGRRNSGRSRPTHSVVATTCAMSASPPRPMGSSERRATSAATPKDTANSPPVHVRRRRHSRATACSEGPAKRARISAPRMNDTESRPMARATKAALIAVGIRRVACSFSVAPTLAGPSMTSTVLRPGQHNAVGPDDFRGSR